LSSFSKLEAVEHIFFDLDRTLWDFETNSAETLTELYEEFGLAAKLHVDADTFIHEYKRINDIFWNDYRDGVITKEELRYARFEAAMKFFGHDDRQLASAIGEEYVWRSPRRTVVVPGAFEVLEYLKPKYRLHIITNGFEEVQHTKMQSSGLAPYFEEIINSETAGAKKPSPVIFNHALKRTGASAANSLMIGDHFEADIQGALDQGWKAVYFEPEDTNVPLGDFLRIRALIELIGIL
jgi:putative hydrolase of the HAD superfamily